MDISLDLRAINSMTKYPSIETYHAIDPKNGQLQDKRNVQFDEDDMVVITEKVDGTNVRVIVFPDGDYIIGSREELLYARGDRIPNPALGIVAYMRPRVEHRMDINVLDVNVPTVYYGELYGGNVGKNARNYTQDKSQFGFRLFDVLMLPEYEELLAQPLEQIAAWRDRGGQQFYSWESLRAEAEVTSWGTVPWNYAAGKIMFETIEQGVPWLEQIVSRETKVRLSADYTQLGGEPEGAVVRNATRSKIAKIRYEDYERTLRKRK